MTKSNKPRSRSLPSRPLYPRKKKQVVVYKDFEKTPESFLYYLKNIYGKKQFDIYDQTQKQKFLESSMVKDRNGDLMQAQFTKEDTDNQYFIKNEFINQHYFLFRNSCFIFNVFVDDETEQSRSLYDVTVKHYERYLDEYFPHVYLLNRKSIINYNYNNFTILGKELYDYLRFYYTNPVETKYLYIDVIYDYGVLEGNGHISCGILDTKTRVFIILNTAPDSFIEDAGGRQEQKIKDVFKTQFNIDFYNFPRTEIGVNQIDLQKIDISDGNCTQWKHVIAYFFIKSRANKFFDYIKDDPSVAFQIITYFYTFLNNFTVEQYNEIAANFLCQFDFEPTIKEI